MKIKQLLVPAAGLAFICATLAFTPKPADQNESTDLEKRIQKLETRIAELEKRLSAQSVQTGMLRSEYWDNLPGSVESRLQRLEKEVFDPDIKMLPCEK
jgi:hypothetical protein